MMDAAGSGIGQVSVIVSGPDGHSPEVWADLATRRIIAVGENLPPVLREQAIAYQDRIRRVIAHYIDEAVREERARLINERK